MPSLLLFIGWIQLSELNNVFWSFQVTRRWEGMFGSKILDFELDCHIWRCWLVSWVDYGHTIGSLINIHPTFLWLFLSCLWNWGRTRTLPQGCTIVSWLLLPCLFIPSLLSSLQTRKFCAQEPHRVLLSFTINMNILWLRAESVPNGITWTAEVPFVNASGIFYCLKLWPFQTTNPIFLSWFPWWFIF